MRNQSAAGIVEERGNTVETKQRISLVQLYTSGICVLLASRIIVEIKTENYGQYRSSLLLHCLDPLRHDILFCEQYLIISHDVLFQCNFICAPVLDINNYLIILFLKLNYSLHNIYFGVLRFHLYKIV